MLKNLTVILQKYAAVERINGNEYILLHMYQQIYVKSIWIENQSLIKKLPHLFARLFVISWENNRDCHITMPLSLKAMKVHIKGGLWNKRFRTVQVYCTNSNQIASFSKFSDYKVTSSIIHSLKLKQQKCRVQEVNFRTAYVE